MTPSLPASYSGPGLLDLQLNGFGGFDFNSRASAWTVEDLLRVAAGLSARGIGGALPTFITAEPEGMVARARRYAAMLDDAPELATIFPRIHIEGPFISPDDGPRGAHPLRWCATPLDLPDLIARLREASGERLGILTLAPELPGALDLIHEATAAGICVAIGHTQASNEILTDAIAAGARMSTHLGNGSHQVLPRLANYLQRQLAHDELTASFIADGHHIPWYTLQNFLRAKGPGRAVLVSDSIAAAGVGPGIYPLGEEVVEVSADLRVQMPGRPNLAGSALTLDRAVINVAMHCDVPFAEAWGMASSRPARLLGLEDMPGVDVRVSADRFTPLPAPDGADPRAAGSRCQHE